MWTTLLLASILHNFKFSKKISLQNHGISTLMNMRKYVDPSVSLWNIGNCFSSVFPFVENLNLNQTLSEITLAMRKSFNQQVKDKRHFQQLYYQCFGRSFISPLQPTKVICGLSSVGVMKLSPSILDFSFGQIFRNNFFVDHSNLVLYSIQSQSFYDMAGMLLYYPSVLNDADAKDIADNIIKSLTNVQLEMKLIDALKLLNPKIW